VTEIEVDAIKARRIVRRAMRSRVMRVEFTPGGRQAEGAIQARYSLAGLTSALGWAKCKA
jgi:hypothetical protein